jgi:hypothetical protein
VVHKSAQLAGPATVETDGELEHRRLARIGGLGVGQQDVAPSLVRSLPVEVLDILPDEVPQVREW